jgi:uncharacterized protein YlxW (UPF0749 family)
MRNNEANIFIFIAFCTIGILISMNISIFKGSDSDKKNVFLNWKQYQKAYSYKNKLRNDILEDMEQYKDYSEKLKKYENNDKNEVQVKANINKELEQNKIILGKTAVHGQGLKITLSDGKITDSMDFFLKQMRIVHNTDIIQIINDLNNAGAEAISINGHRIVDTSEVYCSGPFLRVNEVKIASPFLIYAIGNKEVLYNYMMSDENYLKIMITRKTVVNVEMMEDIKISAYNGNYNIKFMKEIN